MKADEAVNKIEEALDYIQEGMEINRSLKHVGFSDEQIEALNKNGEFLNRVSEVLFIEELRIKRIMRETAEKCATTKRDYGSIRTFYNDNYKDSDNGSENEVIKFYIPSNNRIVIDASKNN